MSDIDAREFGKLEAQVEALQKEMHSLSADVKALLELANKGKGGFWMGMTIASFMLVVSLPLLLIDSGNKENTMPSVGKKKFPYSEKGEKEAKEYGKKKGIPVTIMVAVGKQKWVCLFVALGLLPT
jgi:hypothetical protein